MTSAVLKLAACALAHDDARLETLRLKQERASCQCEFEELAEPEVGHLGTLPCWLRDRSSTEDWCDTCRHRERLHQAYCATHPRLASTRRSLYLACAALRKAEAAGRRE